MFETADVFRNGGREIFRNGADIFRNGADIFRNGADIFRNGGKLVAGFPTLGDTEPPKWQPSKEIL